jgi:hypothetical protein
MTELTAAVVTLCACGHPGRRHDKSGLCLVCDTCAGLTITESALVIEPAPDEPLADVAPVRMKTCTRCHDSKPIDEFYLRNRKTGLRSPCCRDCDSTRPRVRTKAKILNVRARNRAMAELARRHHAEFRELLDYFLKIVHAEAEQLAAAPTADRYSKAQTVLLRPGQRRPDQDLSDRIDVARCPHCVTYHDRGHRCENCGAEPCAVAS